MPRFVSFVFFTALLLLLLSPRLGRAGVIMESEPNNTLAGAQSIDGHFTLDFRGDIGSGDHVTNTSTTIPHVTIIGSGNGTYDYYSFTVTTTTPRYAIFDIDYTTAGFDSHLAIWAADGTLLGHNDNYDHLGGAGGSDSDLDSLHALYLMESGTFIVGVARSNAGPDFGGFTGNAPETGDRYVLHVSVEGQEVPEPSSAALLVLGGVVCLGRRWRNRCRCVATSGQV